MGDPLEGHDNAVLSVAFSPDGTKIVSASFDKTIRIWNATTNALINNTFSYPHKSFQANNNWSLSRDGWINFPNNPHGIIWVPPQFRKALWRPQNTCIISLAGFTKISLEDCVYGEDWIKCVDSIEPTVKQEV
ncbi:hypothetical protein BT96DRAFT_861185 [Gymnopus androsaceus JB14]|uniref:Uncharacterized protein n=1 Tax=Gymnopus androsaceus JB14 TaxID=1447944 RepID=A0A6A4HEA9_9AGAR|nr:hypothetical protein BT96DRAFT_861185 [Gymnopus androsaceus JB14]